jgi:hypothetical protein
MNVTHVHSRFFRNFAMYIAHLMAENQDELMLIGWHV